MPFKKEEWLAEFKASSNREIERISSITGKEVPEIFIDSIPETSGEDLAKVVESMGFIPEIVYKRLRMFGFHPTLSAILLIVANSDTPGIVSILVGYLALSIPKSDRVGDLNCDDIRNTLRSVMGSKHSLSEMAYMIPNEESLHRLWIMQKVESSERDTNISDNYLDLNSTYNES